MADNSDLDVVLDAAPQSQGQAEHFGNIMKDSRCGWAAFFPRPMEIGDLFFYDESGDPFRLFNALEGETRYYRERESAVWRPLLERLGSVSTIGLVHENPIRLGVGIKSARSYGASIIASASTLIEGQIRFCARRGRTATLDGSPTFHTSRHGSLEGEEWLRRNARQILQAARQIFRLELGTIRLVRGTTKVTHWKTFIVENLDRDVEVSLRVSGAPIGIEAQAGQQEESSWSQQSPVRSDQDAPTDAIYYKTAAVRERKPAKMGKFLPKASVKGGTQKIVHETDSHRQNVMPLSGTSGTSQTSTSPLSSENMVQHGAKDKVGQPVDWLLDWLLQKVPSAEYAFATDEDWISVQVVGSALKLGTVPLFGPDLFPPQRTDDGRPINNATNLLSRLQGCMSLQLGVTVQQDNGIAYLSWTDAPPVHLCELKWRVYQSDTPMRESMLFVEYVRVWLEEEVEGSFEALQTCNLNEMLRLIDVIMASDQGKPARPITIFCILLRLVTHYFAGDWILAADSAEELIKDIVTDEGPNHPVKEQETEVEPKYQLICIAALKYREQARLKSLVYAPQGTGLQVMDIPSNFREKAMEANAAANDYEDSLPVLLLSLQMQVAAFARNEQSAQYFGSTPQWEDDALQQSIKSYAHDLPASLSLLTLHAQRILYSVEGRKDLLIIMRAIKRLLRSDVLEKVPIHHRDSFKAQVQATFSLLTADALVTTWAPPETWGLIIWERLDADFYERPFETVLVDRAAKLAQARRGISILTPTAGQRKEAGEWYTRGLAASSLPERLQAALKLRLGFLEMLEACSTSPSINMAACFRAYQYQGEAVYLFQTSGYHADYLTALTHRTLLAILLGAGSVKSDIETCALAVGRWGKTGGGYTFAVCLGHFCSAIGRQWLALCGDARVTYQCHQLAARIFSHLGADVAEGVSLTVLANIVFHFGQISDIHSVAEEGRSLAFRALSIWERVWMTRRGSQESKSYTLYTAFAQRTASILYAHLVNFVPTSNNDAEALLCAMSHFEELSSWLNVFGFDGRLKEWTSVPDGYPAESCVPPQLYSWALSVKCQANFMKYHIVARYLKRNGEDELFEGCSSEASKVADAFQETNPIVYSLLKSVIHLQREELDDASYHYANYTQALEEWQRAILDPSLRMWALSHSCEDAMYWFYRASQPVQAKERWDTLMSLYPDPAEALETAEGNWRSLAVLAFAGERDLARERFSRAMDLYAIERAKQGRLELRTAFSSDANAAHLHFRAARINFDEKYELMPDGTLEAAFSCIERGKALEVMDRLQQGSKENEDGPSLGDSLEQLIRNFHGSPVQLESLRKSFEMQRSLEKGLHDKSTAHSVPLRFSQVSQERATLKTLRAVLPPDTVVLYYAFFLDMFYSWAIPADASLDIEFKGHNLRAYKIRSKANAFLEDLSRPPFSINGGLDEGEDEREAASARDAQLKKNGEWLADLLLAPFSHLLKKGSHLVIVPHADLHRMPFEALPWRGDYLGVSAEMITISYVPCASLLLHILRGRQSTTAAPAKLLVLGVGLNLVHVAKEVDLIHKGSPDSICLRNEQVSENAVLRQLESGNFDSLHFSGHGEFDTYSPPNSRLILAGKETLTLFALQQSAHGRLKSVSLGACHAGSSSQTLGGDDAQGFAHYFLGMGASQTVASLWKAEDIAASTMMKGLYGLEDANIFEARRSIRKKQKDPYFWAPFVVFGYPILEKGS